MIHVYRYLPYCTYLVRVAGARRWGVGGYLLRYRISILVRYPYIEAPTSTSTVDSASASCLLGKSQNPVPRGPTVCKTRYCNFDILQNPIPYYRSRLPLGLLRLLQCLTVQYKVWRTVRYRIIGHDTGTRTGHVSRGGAAARAEGPAVIQPTSYAQRQVKGPPSRRRLC